jgi:hypothetical protein
MYFADIFSSLELLLKDCAGWRARSIMAEVFAEGNVEKEVVFSFSRSRQFEPLPGADETGCPRFAVFETWDARPLTHSA